MSDNLPKQELLLKLLNMTTAVEDNVSLIAIRKANELLKSNGWDWERLLQGKIKIVGDPWASTGAKYVPPTPEPAPSRRTAPRPSPPPPPPEPWRGQVEWHTKTPEHPYFNWDTLRYQRFEHIPSGPTCIHRTSAHIHWNPDTSLYQRTPYTPKTKPIGSTWINKFMGHCFCCGTFVDAQKGFLFKPHGRPELICTLCNSTSGTIVPLKAAKKQAASLNSILGSI